jgi:hypothetical protein
LNLQGILELLGQLWQVIKDQMPAFLLSLYENEETKIRRVQAEKAEVELKLKEEQNHEAIDQKYSGKSDSDILRDGLNGPDKPGDSSK